MTTTRRWPHSVQVTSTRTALAILGSLLLLTAAPAAATMPSCTVAALSALDVPHMTITSATDVAATPTTPEYCDVHGSVMTTGGGAQPGSAGFEIKLPAAWSNGFLFFGTGGLAGVLSPSANPVDVASSLGQGYATVVTDTGHVGQGGFPGDPIGPVTDARWALKAPGVPDTPKVTDYYFRAVHAVTESAKHLVQSFYGGQINRAYFDGCSNGGRMAFVQATHYPNDYDGIIAGAPFMDIRVIIGGTKNYKQLLSPATFVPSAKLPAVDAAVYASCDAADGVTDGLVQNPAACAFDPETLVPAVLSPGQADSLRTYFSATRDTRGGLVYNGASVTDLDSGGGMDLWATGLFVPAPFDFSANEPWGDSGFLPAPLTWQFVDHIMKYLVQRDPTFDIRDFDVSTEGIVGDQALALFDNRTEAGDGDIPADLLQFIKKGKKLLIYHGYSDPALTPFRTITYYRDLAELAGGYGELQDSVRLFMVPGMQHCGGGPGPNTFDTLTPLDNWVRNGQAPDGIVASHPSGRTMPLCKFPEMAHYDGVGPVTDAASWSCPSNQDLLTVGPNGAEAGL
ncbi:MAG TPA: tannase/feruloyl esterase family alpha/beta hydrolase [Methylomirabilota bacterium]|nr:tannase/feruloyl esterase family alpha/beta hydrolase [Methylomirabilota bacterium]